MPSLCVIGGEPITYNGDLDEWVTDDGNADHGWHQPVAAVDIETDG